MKLDPVKPRSLCHNDRADVVDAHLKANRRVVDIGEEAACKARDAGSGVGVAEELRSFEEVALTSVLQDDGRDLLEDAV